MAKLHSLLVLQQFMRSLGEDMEEAELVRSIKQNESKRTGANEQTSEFEWLKPTNAIQNLLIDRRSALSDENIINF